jgi:endothelin-converting enzyme/putative endopeptidase
MNKSRIALAAAILLAGAAPILAQPAASSPGTQPAAKARFGSWGVDLGARDSAIRPGQDFWRYANNRWFQANPIPADRTSWGVASVLSEELEGQLRAILETAGQSSNPADRQVADLYASYMDEAGIEARGIAPLRPHLARIAAISNREELLRLFATPGFVSPVSVGILPNPADPTRYVAFASQSGLGMPGRDYYLRDGEQFERARTAYREYIVTLHRLAGIADAEAKADAIIALERRIAEAHWTPERSRDVRQLINPMNREQLNTLAPQFDWTSWLQAYGLGDVPIVIAGQTTAITAIGQMLDTVPLQTWKDYATFHALNGAAPFLPRAFVDANFNFFSRTLRGVEQQRPRWKRGLDVVNGAVGESVGRIYMERHFPAESRQQMSELIVNLRAAFTERLQRLEWMDEETRTQAVAKLEAFDPRIGGPERFIDYSAMRVDRADLVGNMLRAQQFDWNLQLSRLPNPVDRSLWGMNPQEINAYYSPLANQITFPAAILQPPFFDPHADPAVNYGAIGAVIGHEIGHGFDDQGRRFDAQGRYRDWWTETSAQRFSERTARLVQQYNQYDGIPGQRVNGELTLGENIGDLGGLEMAYAAYRRHVAQHGEPPVIDGLTGDQRFFLAFAQAWRNNVGVSLAPSRLPHR